MKEAIKRAIKGGWKSGDIPTWWDELRTLRQFCNGWTLLDPFFWQALAKAEGWSSQFEIMTGLVNEETDEVPMSEGKRVDKWEYEMHRFIDHIIEGKPIDDFFNNLLK